MEKYLEIRLTKCRIFLTEQELTGLLSREPSLWAEALKRGKAFTRARTARERESKYRGKRRSDMGEVISLNRDIDADELLSRARELVERKGKTKVSRKMYEVLLETNRHQSDMINELIKNLEKANQTNEKLLNFFERLI